MTAPPRRQWFLHSLQPPVVQKEGGSEHSAQAVGLNMELKVECSAHPLTAVLGVLTSFFSWSSSIFRISLSDISRAILAAGASQTLLSER